MIRSIIMLTVLFGILAGLGVAIRYGWIKRRKIRT